MKTDKEVIAALIELIKLLIVGGGSVQVLARLESLEAWREGVEAVWPVQENN